MDLSAIHGGKRRWALSAHCFALIFITGLNLMGPKAQAYTSVNGQYVVQLQKPRSQYDNVALERSLSGKIIDQVRPDVVVVQRRSGEPAESAVRSLERSSVVKVAEPNYIYKAIKTPNDPEFGKLWGMSNTGGPDSAGVRGLKGVDIGAERAWEISTGSKNVVVAVIDTGVDFKIPDLANNAWVNSAEANGQAGVDDDQNGYIDDVNGFNFVRNVGDSTDDHGHGSHCAGTVGAEGDDGKGVAGVAWNVSIMSLKFLDSNGSGTLANAVKAIDYARKMGAKILSNSWGGGGPSEIVRKAIEDAEKEGILFVAAAGNDGADNDRFPTYPASFPNENIVSVAALDNRGELASFSNFGTTSVDIAAPGVNVLSTVPRGFAIFSGTSMAAPHVSGIAALLLAENPTWSFAQLKERLLSSARPLQALNGKIVSGGIADAYHALSGEPPPQDPNDPSLWAESMPYQISTPHPYPAKFEETYTVQIPGAKRVSVHFSKFDTESGYDKVEFFNGAGESLGIWSGKKDDRFGPIADGDTIVLKFKADDSVQKHGFDVDRVVYEK